MGITGLLPLLRPICEKAHVSEFRNKRVGIDVFGWLHKGAFACAYDLCVGKPTMLYVRYVIERVKMLQYHNVVPVVVFDGANLPMKAITHTERRAKRAEALEKAKSYQAKNNMKAAIEWYQRAVPVTTDMVRNVIRELRRMNVEYVVAPYEADAQLAWMALNGHVDCVLTEDSDLIVYGAPKIIYKVGKDGSGDLFNHKNLPSLDEPPMYNITPDMFMWMCVCAGCDFFEGVRNLGMKRAHSLVKKCRTLNRLLHSIRADQRYPVDKGFMVEFYRACLVFRHQTVYDTVNGKALHLSEFEEAYAAMLPSGIVSKSDEGIYDLDFLGKKHSDGIMKKIAMGFVNPNSLEEYTDPLDIPVVERPMPARSPRKLVERNRKSNRPRSFQVLPVSRPTSGPVRMETKSRDRMARNPISFDPLCLASKYFPEPSAPRSKGIWNRYKRPKSLNDVDKILGRSFGSGGNGFQLSKKRRLIENGEQDVSPARSPRNRPEKEDSLSPMNRAKRRLSATTFNNRISPTTPKNSLARFMNRFQTSMQKTNRNRKSSRARDNVSDEMERERKKPRSGSDASNDSEVRPDDDSRTNEVCEDEGTTAKEPPEERKRRSPIEAVANTEDVVVISDSDEHPENGRETKESNDEEDYVIRSRFFQPGKRLMLPAKLLTTTARGRPLVLDAARSHARSTRALESFGRRAKGRAVINKNLKQRESRRHTS